MSWHNLAITDMFCLFCKWGWQFFLLVLQVFLIFFLTLTKQCYVLVIHLFQHLLCYLIRFYASRTLVKVEI